MRRVLLLATDVNTLDEYLRAVCETIQGLHGSKLSRKKSLYTCTVILLFMQLFG